METVTAITALLIAAGTIFAAIYAARSGAEKTLKEHIEKLDADILKLQKDNEILRGQYDELNKKYERERERADRLEKRITSLTRKRNAKL